MLLPLLLVSLIMCRPYYGVRPGGMQAGMSAAYLSFVRLCGNEARD